jgi:hypothetical protein
MLGRIVVVVLSPGLVVLEGVLVVVVLVVHLQLAHGNTAELFRWILAERKRPRQKLKSNDDGRGGTTGICACAVRLGSEAAFESSSARACMHESTEAKRREDGWGRTEDGVVRREDLLQQAVRRGRME